MKNSYFLLFLGLCNVSNNASMTESGEGRSGESNSTVERLIFFIVCL